MATVGRPPFNKMFDRHEDAEEKVEQWELFRRSYVGGKEYLDGHYLIQHERESDETYKRRVAESTYVNYCSPVVDIYNSFLFRETPRRNIDTSNQAIQAFMRNADLRGRRAASVMRELSRWASVYGHMGVIVDKPISNEARSRADELRYGIRPYICYYAPQDIINWGYENDYNGPPVLDFLVLREQERVEETEVYRVWYRNAWELWQIERDNQGMPKEDPILLDSGDNPLGVIPFVLIPNRDTFDEMSGVSDLVDIAPINQRIYRYDSSALEIIERCAFPFLEVPVDRLRGPSGNDEDVVVGTGNVVERGIDDPVGHRWVEPTQESLVRILDWRTQAVQDIRETAKMGGIHTNARQGSAAFSGSGLEVRFQQLNAVLSSKAELMEQAEINILKLVAMWENMDIEPEVHYPRKFGIRDVITDLDTAIRGKEVIFSPLYDKMVQKSLAGRQLSDMGYSAPEIKDVEKEIDSMPYIPAASKLTVTGGANGVSVVEKSQAEQAAQLAAQQGVTGNTDNNNDGGSTGA